MKELESIQGTTGGKAAGGEWATLAHGLGAARPVPLKDPCAAPRPSGDGCDSCIESCPSTDAEGPASLPTGAADKADAPGCSAGPMEAITLRYPEQPGGGAAASEEGVGTSLPTTHDETLASGARLGVATPVTACRSSAGPDHDATSSAMTTPPTTSLVPSTPLPTTSPAGAGYLGNNDNGNTATAGSMPATEAAAPLTPQLQTLAFGDCHAGPASGGSRVLGSASSSTRAAAPLPEMQQSGEKRLGTARGSNMGPSNGSSSSAATPPAAVHGPLVHARSQPVLPSRTPSSYGVQREPQPMPRSSAAAAGQKGGAAAGRRPLGRQASGSSARGAFTPVYGAVPFRPASVAHTPPPVYASASTRMALDGVLSNRSARSRMGSAMSVGSHLGNVDFRPRWR